MRNCEVCDTEVGKCRRFCDQCNRTRTALRRKELAKVHSASKVCACGCGREFTPRSPTHVYFPGCSYSRAGIYSNKAAPGRPKKVIKSRYDPELKATGQLGKGANKNELERRIEALVVAARRPDYDAHHPERYL